MKQLSKNKLIFLGLIILLVGSGMALFYSSHESHQHENMQEFYTCSMHPQIVQDKPGNCPICGMRLIKKQRETSSEEYQVKGELKQVSISPQKQALGNLATTKVKKQTLTKTLSTASIIAFDRELFLAQQEFVSALQLQAASRGGSFTRINQQNRELAESAQKKLLLLGMSETEIKELRQRKKPDESLYQPQAGDDFWINAYLYEQERNLIELGQSATLFTDNLQTKMLSGVIKGISPVLDPLTRTFKVRIRVKNTKGNVISPETFSKTRIKINLGEQLALPQSSVINTGERKIVWVKTGENKFSPREVSLGQQADDTVVVLAGIEVGDEVVSQGAFLLDSEAQLKRAFEDGQSSGGMSGHQH